jgi:SAM-dependent MidA family methyltransferase
MESGVVLTDSGFALEDQRLPEGRAQGAARNRRFRPGTYGYLSEINFAAEALVRTIAPSLEQGMAIFIDYGFPSASTTTRSAPRGRCAATTAIASTETRSSCRACRTSPRTWISPRWARAAESGGAELLGFTTQAYFLISCGLGVLVSGGDPTVTLSKLQGTSAVHRLINPRRWASSSRCWDSARAWTAGAGLPVRAPPHALAGGKIVVAKLAPQRR